MDQGELALATVIDVEGSSYRRIGARMLIQANGRWTGAISGGCLEGNALRRARQVMRSGVPELVVYDTRSDESAMEIGASLGCNGVIQVWIEPVQSGLLAYLAELESAFLADGETWFARVMEGNGVGKCEAGTYFKLASEGLALAGTLLKREEGIQQIAVDGKPVLFTVEKVRPVVRLHIFGGGYDAQPLSRLAKGLGWLVTVTDDCAAKALPIRFPDADQVLQLKRDTAVAELQPDRFTAAVLLSHNYAYDKAILNDLLDRPCLYIGILGPRKRFHRLDEEFGGRLSELPQLHAPVGLDIGAETPDEIALAVVAEIQAVQADRTGGKLKRRRGFIHERKAVVG